MDKIKSVVILGTEHSRLQRKELIWEASVTWNDPAVACTLLNPWRGYSETPNLLL